MTPWFDKYTRPHWIGIYETRITETPDGYNYWNGLFWERTVLTPERLPSSIGDASFVQHIEWRGFTKEQS